MERLRDWPDEAPKFTSKLVTLIGQVEGEYRFATTITGKRELARSAAGELVAVWTGHWSSDAFLVTAEQVAAEL